MRKKVFIATKVPKEIEAYIAKHCEYKMWDSNHPIPRDVLVEEVKDVEGLLIAGGKIDEELLHHAPHLKVVSNVHVGYNNFDIEAMKNKGVLGTITPNVLNETVVDLVLGLILSSTRRIVELDRYVKAGKWKIGNSEELFGIDVYQSTLGIIGMGRIGESIAKRAKSGFDMNVLYQNRNRKREIEENLQVQYCEELNELLKLSDFIVLMTPLTPETIHLIGEREFSQMKETAFFINASRGQTVDEAALIHALQENKIRGAALDVFEQEPINLDNPLLKMSNVITVPHIGSATHKTRYDMAMLGAQNLVKVMNGEAPPSVVPELKELV